MEDDAADLVSVSPHADGRRACGTVPFLFAGGDSNVARLKISFFEKAVLIEIDSEDIFIHDV